jgi:hypothetical protein
MLKRVLHRSPLMIVASMPMLSPVVRFTPLDSPLSPRKILPAAQHDADLHAQLHHPRHAARIEASASGSMHSPDERFPRTSPLSFNTIRRY